MRANKNNPRQVYKGFRDWLFNWNPIWNATLFFGYAYYLMTTEEV
jgi:hypothetical protein